MKIVKARWLGIDEIYINETKIKPGDTVDMPEEEARTRKGWEIVGNKPETKPEKNDKKSKKGDEEWQRTRVI